MMLLRNTRWQKQHNASEGADGVLPLSLISNDGKANDGMDLEKEQSAQKKNQLLTQLQAVAEGDQQACQAFVGDHYQWLVIIVRQQFPYSDLYLDIVHDAFALAIDKLKAGEIDKLESIKYYLRTAAINIGFSYLRKDQKFRSDMNQDLIHMIHDSGQSVMEDISWSETKTFVQEVMSDMTVKRDQEILQQFYLEDKDKLTVCQNLNISPDHFSRVLFRAKSRLKSLIEKKGQKSNVVSMFRNVPSWVLILTAIWMQ